MISCLISKGQAQVSKALQVVVPRERPGFVHDDQEARDPLDQQRVLLVPFENIARRVCRAPDNIIPDALS